MKRISISAAILLVFAAAMAEARPASDWYGFGYNYHRYRTRWSMYAHGLVSGVVNYTPYAPGVTGLVEGYVRYSPYAFGPGRSGLVSDYGGGYYYLYSPGYYRVIRHYVPVSRSCKLSETPVTCGTSGQSRLSKTYNETTEDRKARREVLAKAREERRARKTNDGKEIIADYLRANNIPFRTTRILSIEGRTVSVDFLLNDGKTILKYWNLAEIPLDGKQQERKRKFFEKYVESWKVARDEHLRAGGSIHQIIPLDHSELPAKLQQCTGLDGVDKVYANK